MTVVRPVSVGRNADQLDEELQAARPRFRCGAGKGRRLRSLRGPEDGAVQGSRRPVRRRPQGARQDAGLLRRGAPAAVDPRSASHGRPHGGPAGRRAQPDLLPGVPFAFVFFSSAIEGRETHALSICE